MLETDEQKNERLSEELALAFIRNWGLREEPEKLAQRFFDAKKIIEEVVRKNCK